MVADRILESYALCVLSQLILCDFDLVNGNF